MAELTAKQDKFCQLVAEGNTYSDAYKGAYDAEKMGINSIYVNSSVLMSDTKISIRIKELQDEIRKRAQVTLDEVLQEMANWLRFDPADVIDEAECIKPLKTLPKEVRKSISEIRVQELYTNIDSVKTKIGEIKNIKFIDKRATADMFMKKFGQYIENHNIKIDDLEHVRDILTRAKQV